MIRRYSAFFSAAALACALAFADAAPALAQGDLDTPTVALGVGGWGKQALTITAGPSGCPNGFTVFWMTQADYLASGSQWWLYGDPRQGEAYYWGTPELNDGGGAYTTFLLGPNQSIEVEIGDVFDESGVTSSDWRTDWNCELEPGKDYMFCAWANATPTVYQSAFSENLESQTSGPHGCIFTQGYWKNHSSAWPVTSLTLGTVSYTKAQLLQILNKPVVGNGLISLAHQLITTKLNIALGANPSTIASTVAAADAQIGNRVVPPIGSGFLSPGSTSAKTQTLDNFNNGCGPPVSCSTTRAVDNSWGHLKSLYR